MDTTPTQETAMASYRIMSHQGQDMGIYDGETETDALATMTRDVGYEGDASMLKFYKIQSEPDHAGRPLYNLGDHEIGAQERWLREIDAARPQQRIVGVDYHTPDGHYIDNDSEDY